MRLEPIINLLLEMDAYKASMGQAIYHQFSSYTTIWEFKCRNEDVIFNSEMIEEIKAQIRHYCDLRFTEEELDYLRSIPWIRDDYVDFLRLWHPRYKDFDIREGGRNGLKITTRGTWLNTSQYEIPTLAIVNEVYYRMKYANTYSDLIDSFKERAEEKIAKLKSGEWMIGKFSEFGLRRRLSGDAQNYIVRRLASEQMNNTLRGSTFIGTSNLYLAKKYNLTPVGTMAHEWIMCVGQGNPKHNSAYSNWYALNAWVKEYGVLNGIALTDTIGTDVFLKDFQLTYSTLFSGVRHDSGDPFEWADKMIKHYEELGINPLDKTLLFSDSLDFKKASEIYSTVAYSAGCAFGIGTYLSNDTVMPPLNIVMKVVQCNGSPVAKISDDPGKATLQCGSYFDYLKRSIDWRMCHDTI